MFLRPFHVTDRRDSNALWKPLYYLWHHIWWQSLLCIVILEGADLDTLSSKKVRQQLEERLKFDLSDR